MITGVAATVGRRKVQGMYMVGAERLAHRFKAYSKATVACVGKEIAAGAFAIQKSARKNAPVNQGTLRRSISVLLTKGGMTAKVGTGLHYAFFMEFGTGPAAAFGPRPQFPLVFSDDGRKRLKKWGRKHGWADEDIWKLALYIGQHGLKGSLFLTKAWKFQVPRIMANIRTCTTKAGISVGFKFL